MLQTCSPSVRRVLLFVRRPVEVDIISYVQKVSTHVQDNSQAVFSLRCNTAPYHNIVIPFLRKPVSQSVFEELDLMSGLDVLPVCVIHSE